MQLFVMNNTDYTRRIISGSYNINEQDEFESWKDGNGITHRDVYRGKASGSFKIKFWTRSEYTAFINALQSVKQTGGYYPVSLFINNKITTRQVNAYIHIAPVVKATYTNNNDYEVFDVEVEER